MSGQAREPNRTTKHTWRRNPRGHYDDDDIYNPPDVSAADLEPPEQGLFRMHDPRYTFKVYGELYKDMLDTCFDKCVVHPAGEQLSTNTCIRSCGLLYHQAFNMVTTENAKRLTMMKYLGRETVKNQ